MNDVILHFDYETPEEEALLFGALDAFVTLKVDAGRSASDAPDMMVQTIMSPNGQSTKKLIFQDRKWADAFLSFWEDRKQSVAA